MQFQMGEKIFNLHRVDFEILTLTRGEQDIFLKQFFFVIFQLFIVFNAQILLINDWLRHLLFPLVLEK